VSENKLSQPDGVGNDTTRASQRCQPNIPVNQLEPEHTHKDIWIQLSPPAPPLTTTIVKELSETDIG
jgi:hypothetical protein